MIVLGGAAAPVPPDDDAVRDALAARQAAGDDRKTAIATVTRELQLSRRRVYELTHQPAAARIGASRPPPGRQGRVSGRQ